jgi:putative two-component system response regulator
MSAPEDDRATHRRAQEAKAAPRATILLVDDVPENLRILAEVLVAAGHSTRAVTSGKAALKLIETIKVDLVLLDINMPEMSGFELCTLLKRAPSTRDIPVLFLSAATDTEHKVEAFRRGGVDYISKPFQFEEVRARVETHLRIRRLQLEQKLLLERTLAGAIRTLMECLHLASPVVFARAKVVRDAVVHLVAAHHVAEPWPLRVAGALAFIGCLALPDDTVHAAFTKSERTPEIEEAFRRHAEIGKRLLLEIPRLERVAEIVGAQYTGVIEGGDAEASLGARILRVAQAYGVAVLDGSSPAQARAQLVRKHPEDADLLARLEGFEFSGSGEAVEGSIAELLVGSTLVDPVKTAEGILLLGAGDEVTQLMLLRLQEYVRSKRVADRFRFRTTSRKDER